jgi:hypothetical protein
MCSQSVPVFTDKLVTSPTPSVLYTNVFSEQQWEKLGALKRNWEILFFAWMFIVKKRQWINVYRQAMHKSRRQVARDIKFSIVAPNILGGPKYETYLISLSCRLEFWVGS